MLEITLKNIGFKDKEIRVFLELLKRGKATPHALAQATGINRATVYSVAKTLIKKGVIAEDLGGKSHYLVALPPEDLTVLIEKEKKALDRKKRLVWKAIDELASVPTGTQYAVPHIRFVEDENVEEHLYKYMNVWEKSILKSDPHKSWWGFQDHTFVEHFEDWIDASWKQAHKDVYVRLLSNEAPAETAMVGKGLERRRIRFWDTAQNFTATTWVLGDYIVMIYTQERPFYLIEIHNAVLAHNMREVFRGIWKEIEKKPYSL